MCNYIGPVVTCAHIRYRLQLVGCMYQTLYDKNMCGVSILHGIGVWGGNAQLCILSPMSTSTDGFFPRFCYCGHW